MDAAQADRRQILLLQIDRQVAQTLVGVGDEHVQCVAEYRTIEDARRVLDCGERRPERLAFKQQKLAAERGALEFFRTADGDESALIDEGGAVAIFGLVHVMGRHQHA